VTRAYIDTSALAKWYVPEAGSEAFATYMLQEADEAVTSGLTPVELRCVFARKRRAGLVTTEFEQEAYARFVRQVGDGEMLLLPWEGTMFMAARELIDRLAGIALRTLDALHLAAAQAAGARELATADRVMGDAAQALGLRLRYFGAPGG
jgi:uncharacterized protein